MESLKNCIQALVSWIAIKQVLFWFCSTLEPSAEGETAIFLSGQEKIWKGLIYMQSVAKFVTKAYLVSGSFDHLKEVSVLPDH